MYTSLVKLLGNKGLFSLTADDEKKVKVHNKDKFAMLVGPGKIVSLKDGEEILDGEIQANQKVIIYPEVNLIPSKYHCIVSSNPELVLKGASVSPLTSIVRPTEEGKIALLVHAYKKIDLDDLEHIFELYQID